MRIQCLTTFLDGRDRYEQGDVRTVPDEAGARFVAAGWAVADGDVPPPAAAAAPTELSIDNAKHDQGARHG